MHWDSVPEPSQGLAGGGLGGDWAISCELVVLYGVRKGRALERVGRKGSCHLGQLSSPADPLDAGGKRLAELARPVGCRSGVSEGPPAARNQREEAGRRHPSKQSICNMPGTTGLPRRMASHPLYLQIGKHCN